MIKNGTIIDMNNVFGKISCDDLIVDFSSFDIIGNVSIGDNVIFRLEKRDPSIYLARFIEKR